MKFNDLIKSHHWLSIELTLLDLYPDQNEIIDEYRKVFETLHNLQPVDNDMLIVLTEYESDSDEKVKSAYADVSGRKRIPEQNSITDSYAMEFVKWENWLGMELAPETKNNFSELEIIAHCLYEMTFCGYEQEEIQEQLDSIQKTVDEYKNLTDEEKNKKTISLDDMMKKFGEQGGS
ncbi:MAG: hypothetical protein IT250_11960 [Chitinophagaceae bacterium]|nr:hypothetical protein [Chitinophagaceae bacterium]